MATGTRHGSLARGPADLIGGKWVELGEGAGGGLVQSRNPARPAEMVWSGVTRVEHVGEAVAAARRALPAWASAAREKRFAVLRRFAELSKQRSAAVAEIICDETGKVMWESRGEASALAAKVDITLDASPTGGMRRVEEVAFDITPTRGGRAFFKPHGVMAVIGPFNFPAHLANGHIVPALAMGNTIVFKPSDKAPGVGQALVEMFAEALEAEGWGPQGGGIVNLVQGAADVATALTTHEGIDGILFTGSWPVGRRIMEANLDRPGRIVALEMGGNNAAAVMDDADLRQAAIEIVRCSFNTTGQRCTCTRRAVVHRRVADRLIPAIVEAAKRLVIGDPRSTTPVFTGPIISGAARQAVLDFQERLRRAGGEVLLEATAPRREGDGFYITPGVVRVERFCPTESAMDAGCDEEVFGPLLRIAVVDSLDDLIEQTNATRYGLAASIFTRSEDAARRFLFEARTGCVNINTGTAGASSKLPFGGLGLSGNHRPAGSFSLDYCAYPVAAMHERGDAAQIAEGMSFEESWMR